MPFIPDKPIITKGFISDKPTITKGFISDVTDDAFVSDIAGGERRTSGIKTTPFTDRAPFGKMAGVIPSEEYKEGYGAFGIKPQEFNSKITTLTMPQDTIGEQLGLPASKFKPIPLVFKAMTPADIEEWNRPATKQEIEAEIRGEETRQKQFEKKYPGAYRSRRNEEIIAFIGTSLASHGMVNAGKGLLENTPKIAKFLIDHPAIARNIENTIVGGITGFVSGAKEGIDEQIRQAGQTAAIFSAFDIIGQSIAMSITAGKDIYKLYKIPERAIVPISDDVLFNAYKTAPQNIKGTMARNNIRLREILLKQKGMAEVTATGKIIAPEQKTFVKPTGITADTKPTPISEAEKVGKVVGIDAQSGLPVIDRTQKATPPVITEPKAVEPAEITPFAPETDIITKEREILAKSGIPEADIGLYIAHTEADGAKLRTYAEQVAKGEITTEKAVEQVKADYAKTKAVEPAEAVAPSVVEVPELLKVGDITNYGEIEEVYKIPPKYNQGKYQYKIEGQIYNERLVEPAEKLTPEIMDKRLAQETIEDIKSEDPYFEPNKDGTITLYHKTTDKFAEKIDESGVFNEGSYFALSEEAAEKLASTNKKGKPEIVKVNVDPAAISYSNEEAFAEFGLKRIGNKWVKGDQELPITEIAKPTEEVEFGIGIPPPKTIREAINSASTQNILPEKKVSALGEILKFYLGTKRERFQVMAGDKAKGDAWFNAVRQMEVNYNSIEAMVEKRNNEIFKGLPIPIREHIHDIAKGISINADGKIVGGGLQPAGIIKDKKVLVGQLLTDGRVVGSEVDTGEYQTYRYYDTLADYNELIKKYPQAKLVFDKLLALSEQIDKTKLGVKLPAFAREVMKSQFDIKSTHPEDYRYVPSVPKEQRLFTKIGNLFKSYTASGRKYKTGVLAETGQEDKDLLKTLTSKQNEFAYENLFNNTIGDILATILEPIGKGGVKPGFIEINLNRPKLKKILELKKDVLKANGIDVDNLSKYQYPMGIEKEFNLQKQAKFSPELQSVVDDIAKKTDKTVGFILSNYLIRLATTVRNFTSGMTQYNLRTLTHTYEGLFGKGFSPALQDIKSLGRVFKPSVWEELPKEILGLNFYSQIPENVRIMDLALVPFRAVETYFKRASFDADLNIFANRKANEMKIPSKKRKQFIEDFRVNYFQDLFNIMADNSNSVTFDYSDKNYIIQKMSNPIGRGIIPFPNYYYHKMRMYAEYSPLGLTGMTPENKVNKISKALAGITMFIISSAIALKIADERKEKLKKLELKKLPYEFDTTGRIKVYSDDTVERWLRVYDLPFIGDVLYSVEILQKQAGIDDWIRDSLSLGPLFNTAAMFVGLRSKYTQGKPTASLMGEQIRGFIPFGAYINYLRILTDKNKRQTYAKDYNAFQNFLNPITDIIPGVSKTLEPQTGKTGKEKGQVRKYDIPAETMKLFFLNVRSVDKAEFEQYTREQFRAGKVQKRIRAETLKKMEFEQELKKRK